LALGAYGLAAFSPDLTTAPFVQRFHAALVLLLTVAFTLSALRSVTVGASYGIEARLLSAPAFLAWASYVDVWRSPNASPPVIVVGLLLAAALSALVLFEGLRHRTDARST
jgi:hypothetical protein